MPVHRFPNHFFFLLRRGATMVDGASSIFVVRRCSISPAPPPRGPRPRPSQSHAAAPWCAVHPGPQPRVQASSHRCSTRPATAPGTAPPPAGCPAERPSAGCCRRPRPLSPRPAHEQQHAIFMARTTYVLYVLN